MKSWQIQRAREIFASLGAKAAVGYLRLRGWSPEATIWILYAGRRG